MEIIQRKARDVKSGETVLDRGTRFIIKEIRVSAEYGPIAFIDIRGFVFGSFANRPLVHQIYLTVFNFYLPCI